MLSGYGPRGMERTVGSLTMVSDRSHFPAAVGGVITLPANTTWFLTDFIDLDGDRIVCAGNAAVWGASPETAGLSSTGLTGSPLLYSTSTLTLIGCAFDMPSGELCVEVVGDGTPALDWERVNFTGAGRAVEITDVDNMITSTMAFFGDGVHVMGGVNSLTVTESIFVIGSGLYGIKVDSGAAVGRRVRIGDCAAVVFGTGVGFDVPTATLPAAETFFMRDVNFSGGATYTQNITKLDDGARWEGCRGIDNTERFGSCYMTSNATATTITTQGVYVKVAGTTTAHSENQRFTHTANRLTYSSAFVGVFKLQVILSVEGGAAVEYSIKVVKNGATELEAAPMGCTTRSTGRVQNVTYHADVSLAQGDYLEVFIACTSGTNNPTVTEMNFSVWD